MLSRVSIFCDSFDVFSIFACVIDHVTEGSSFQYQLVWLTDLQHSSSVHNDDFVVICDGVQSVSDGDDGVVFELGL